MMICPELLIACLLGEQMGPGESVLIVGAAR